MGVMCTTSDHGGISQLNHYWCGDCGVNMRLCLLNLTLALHSQSHS